MLFRVRVAEAAFSEEEIEEMQYFLKERGLFAFVKHYVDVEAIPIPKLLLAFGVAVVRPFARFMSLN